MDMWKKGRKPASKVERRASTGEGAPGTPPSLRDFDHPMPRLMDYFRGKSSLPEVESAREGNEED